MPLSKISRALATLVVPAVMTVNAPSALAQQQQQPPQPPRRDYGWVAGSAGVTFGDQVQRSATFAGEYGEDVHPRVQATVTIAYFENVMQQDFQDELAALSSGLTHVSGVGWNLQGRDRAVTLVVGGRYLAITDGAVRPYVGGGGGVINLRRTVLDPRVGNLTSAILTDFGIGDVTLVSTSVTRPLLEGAFGVGFYSGPVYVDVGYRYKRAFHLSAPLDLSQVVAGIGYKF